MIVGGLALFYALFVGLCYSMSWVYDESVFQVLKDFDQSI